MLAFFFGFIGVCVGVGVGVLLTVWYGAAEGCPVSKSKLLDKE